MSEKDLPIIITKKDCPRCVTMKEWLKDNKIEYTERDIDDESYVQQLVRDKEFLKTFCDDESCIVNTPAVSYKGKYWLYFKARASKPEQVWWGSTPMGVAISDKPLGPYVKSKANPLVRPGHEVLVWPHGPGVAAYAKKGGIWHSKDGIHFTRKIDTSTKPVAGAAGAYRKDAFEDDGWGDGITWGLCHVTKGGTLGLQRFECDLGVKSK